MVGCGKLLQLHVILAAEFSMVSIGSGACLGINTQRGDAATKLYILINGGDGEERKERGKMAVEKQIIRILTICGVIMGEIKVMLIRMNGVINHMKNANIKMHKHAMNNDRCFRAR